MEKKFLHAFQLTTIHLMVLGLYYIYYLGQTDVRKSVSLGVTYIKNNKLLIRKKSKCFLFTSSGSCDINSIVIRKIPNMIPRDSLVGHSSPSSERLVINSFIKHKEPSTLKHCLLHSSILFTFPRLPNSTRI